jgi:excisionase family DNA binding protein
MAKRTSRGQTQGRDVTGRRSSGSKEGSMSEGGLIELLTIEEVAARLRVSVLTVRWLRQEGRFAPAIKVGRRLMWDVRDVDAWLKAQRETPKVA